MLIRDNFFITTQMKIKNICLILLLVITIVGGCAEQIKKSSKQPAELVLELADLPEGYTVKEKTPRLKSDVSDDALNLGWQGGYYVRYAKIGENIFDVAVIDQSISVYPVENITKVIDLPYELDENTLMEELPVPNIGDNSRAFRYTTTDELGAEERFYQIGFVKMNIYVNFYMSGTTTDYEFLTQLAKKVEAKIR